MNINGYKKVKVDGETIKKFARSNGLTLAEISRKIGKSDAYMSGIIHSGEMSVYPYELMLRIFNLPNDSFVVKEEVKKKDINCKIDGYSIKLDVWSNSIKMCVMYQGQPISESRAFIKENTEEGLLQAISFASHLMHEKAKYGG